MKYLSQRNPYWASEKLGTSNLTIGRYGCTTTCLSMISDYFKGFKTPAEIARTAPFYTPQGLIIWQNLDFPTMKFVSRIKGYNEGAIIDSLKKPEKAVIFEVNNGSHWVVGIRKFFGDYLIIDPWDGKKKFAYKTYHNITGSAHFIKK